MTNVYQLRTSFAPSRLAALLAVDAERDRQDAQWPAPDGFNDGLALPILVEEVGEVAQAQLMAALNDGDTEHLREELVQVAAVAVRWIEHLDEAPKQCADTFAGDRCVLDAGHDGAHTDGLRPWATTIIGKG